jgi:NAD(P)-dependent dehydrogenase (short-subunit alcohol dehydrogenase family)
MADLGYTPAGAQRGAAVVTGAARGLGLEIARGLSARGYTVLLSDLDAEAARAAAAAIALTGSAVPLDVRDAAACRELARHAAGLPGGLQVWVNNAGVLPTGPAWEHDPDTRRLVLEVNALGTINGTLAAVETMRQAGQGHIVNVVSLAGLVAPPGEALYAASKHAALAFTLGTLFDLRQAGVGGIHVCALCPDGIWTPMLYEKVDDPGAAMSWSGALLDPERVAQAALSLLDHPRPVLTIPRWRGAVVRVFDAFPRLTLRALPLLVAGARRKQRAFKSRNPGLDLRST